MFTGLTTELPNPDIRTKLYGQTALMAAAKMGYLGIVMLLVRNGRANMNLHGTLGITLPNTCPLELCWLSFFNYVNLLNSTRHRFTI
jgi:ankyrin repeat protein